MMIMSVPIFGGIGGVIADKVNAKYHFSSRANITFSLVWMSVLPLWGMVGLLTDDFGIRKGWEAMIVGPYYGLTIGIIQAYSRALFSQLTPKGFETQFFALAS